MNELNFKKLILAMVHAIPSLREPRRIQSTFNQSLLLFVEIEPLLNDLRDNALVGVDEEGGLILTESGYAELHKVDFDALKDALSSLSGNPESLAQLISKIKKTDLPDIGMDVSSYEWTGTVYNTHPRQISEALYESFGGHAQIQIIEDQVVFNNDKWDLMCYPLVNAEFDDSILPGHDDFRIKTIYIGQFDQLQRFVKGFAKRLAMVEKRYSFEYYEIDEEEDVVGEIFELYSANL